MATQDNDLRRRTVPADSNSSPPSTTAKTSISTSPKSTTTSNSYILLEVLRALAGLTILTAVASYFYTSGASLIFNQNARLQSLTSYFGTPLVLTLTTLAAHDGTDASKPIYVAINRTVYDVSSSPHIYGPGGMYGFFGGKDASRSFVTTCFDPVNDLIPDLEGVEEIYVPLWLSKKPDAELKEEWDEVLGDLAGQMGGKSAADLIGDVKKRLGLKRVAALREEAYAEAKERVNAALGNWKRMLEGKNYPVVGTLTYPEAGVTAAQEKARVERVVKLPLCKDALKNRPSMTESLTKAMSAMVKDGKLDINKMKGQTGAAGKAGVAGQAAEAAEAGAGMGRDPKAREAIKEQVRAANPHAANPHAANPHANVPPHHHAAAAQKPLGHGSVEREQLKQGKVMGHAEAGGAAEAVGGVPPHGENKTGGGA